MYFTKVPFWLRWYLKNAVWSVKSEDKALYLTFDDGPHPEVTPFVLDLLKQHNARATFFCVGKNVETYPDVYRRIIDEGHRVGNHTQHHKNAWKVKEAEYLEDVRDAARWIDSDLFRPPYGKITPFLVRALAAPAFNMKTVMWTVLSGDFDVKRSPQKCLEETIVQSEPGAIVVFHDSEKARTRLEYALPGYLEYFSNKQYVFKAL